MSDFNWKKSQTRPCRWSSFSLSPTDFDFFFSTPTFALCLCAYPLCALPLCQLQLRWSSSTFNAPHMNLIRVSAHMGRSLSQWFGDCADQGPFIEWARRIWSNLMSSVSRILCRYISVMLLTRPPSVHLLYHLLASQKLYFFFVYCKQQLNTISFQTLFTSLAFSDQRFTTRL